MLDPYVCVGFLHLLIFGDAFTDLWYDVLGEITVPDGSMLRVLIFFLFAGFSRRPAIAVNVSSNFVLSSLLVKTQLIATRIESSEKCAICRIIAAIVCHV